MITYHNHHGSKKKKHIVDHDKPSQHHDHSLKLKTNSGWWRPCFSPISLHRNHQYPGRPPGRGVVRLVCVRDLFDRWSQVAVVVRGPWVGFCLLLRLLLWLLLWLLLVYSVVQPAGLRFGGHCEVSLGPFCNIVTTHCFFIHGIVVYDG